MDVASRQVRDGRKKRVSLSWGRSKGNARRADAYFARNLIMSLQEVGGLESLKEAALSQKEVMWCQSCADVHLR